MQKRHQELLGDVDGLSPEAVESLAAVLPDDGSVTYADGRLHFEYEAPWIFAEDIVEAIAQALPRDDPEAGGRLNLVDNEEFTLTRYIIRPGEWTTKSASLNDMLDKWARER